MSEIVADHGEPQAFDYLEQHPVFNEFREAKDLLQSVIFDTYAEAWNESAELCASLDNMAYKAGLIGRAAQLRSRELYMPHLMLDVSAGTVAYEPALEPDDHIEGVAVVSGEFAGFTFIPRALSADQQTLNGFIPQLCYNLAISGSLSLPYYRGGTPCAYSPLDTSELVFLEDEEKRKVKGSLERLLSVDDMEAARTIDKVNRRLSDEKRLSSASLRYAGTRIRRMLDAYAPSDDMIMLRFKDELASLLKVRLYADMGQRIELESDLLFIKAESSDVLSVKSDMRVSGPMLDVLFQPHLRKKRGQVIADMTSSHMPCLVMQAPYDGRDTTFYIPLERITTTAYDDQ